MDGISSLYQSSSQSASSSKQTQESLGKNDFFRLLATQLGNQDPMDPVDNREMIAQLAQFSSLEQMTGVNERLEMLQATAAAQINGSVVNLLGDTVWYAGKHVSVSEQTPFEGSYNLSEAAESVVVTVKNAQGETVATWNEGMNAKGEHVLHPEKSSSDVKNLPAGTYTVEIKATDKSGKEVASSTYSKGTVTGVSYQDGTPVLMVGDEKVEPADVVKVTSN